MAESNYQSKQADQHGHIHYTAAEHQVWHTLYQRQTEVLTTSACDAFQQGVTTLGLNSKQIPQLTTINDCLHQQTGWQTAPVPALISFQTFFSLLAEQRFPVATFIRDPNELDYLKEPDIFHEVFGHCTMLTQPDFASFTHQLGQVGASLNHKDQVMLGRLYWFTVEFGLLQTDQELRIYGGGILSSIEETEYALRSPIPTRHPMDLVTVLRTPYRYDEKQLNYFIIDNLHDLYNLAQPDKLQTAFAEAKALGMLPNPHQSNQQDHRSC